MTDSPPSLVTGTTSSHQLAAARIETSLPIAYRLVTNGDGNGNIVPVLQGYYHWRQGPNQGGEWRDLVTQEWLHAKDNIPHGCLPGVQND